MMVPALRVNALLPPTPSLKGRERNTARIAPTLSLKGKGRNTARITQ